MSKGLRSYPKYERSTVASRRRNSRTKGLGYWGAVDALMPKRQIEEDSPKKKAG